MTGKHTSQEMLEKGENIDVPPVVEDPELHILGRSSSSLWDNLHYIQCRRECLLGLHEGLLSKAGILVHNVQHFFHGDGPAMQFEAGNKIGGYYCCVGCDAHSFRFSDLAYCFRARSCTLSERQEFILQGEAWKHKQVNTISKLLSSELSWKNMVTLQGEKRRYNLKGSCMSYARE